MSKSLLVDIFNDLHVMCESLYNMCKSVEKRYKMFIYKKRGFKGYNYNVFNLVRGLKVKKYIIMLLLSLTFVVSFNVSLSASGVGDLEIEPLYAPTMTFVNDDLGKFNYNPFLRRLKTDVLENDNNFLGVDTIQSYDEVTSGGKQELVSLRGAKVMFSASLMYDEFSDSYFDVQTSFVGYNYGTSSTMRINSQGLMFFDINPIDNVYIYSDFFDSEWVYNNPDIGNSNLSMFLTIQYVSGSDLTNPTLLDLVKRYSSSIEGGVYEGGETIENRTMSLSELFSRDTNFTHSNNWGISSNYVITNELLMANNRGVDSLYLDYSNIIIYDEFIINYSQNNYSLIPTSIIVDISTIDNIIWEWNYKVQTDIGLTEIRFQTWTLDSQYMRDNKINVLPQNPLYNVSTNQMSEFINIYGQNQFINLSSARVTINFNTNVNEFDIIQYSVDKDVYDESNELAWYDFDSQGSVSNLGESLLDSANSFLQLEIFPNFRILDILLIAIAIPMLIWVLKVFFGG